MSDDLKIRFPDRLKKINSIMSQPMSHNLVEGDPNWFDGDKQQPDLLRGAPSRAKVWLTEGRAIGCLFQLSKAKLADQKHDPGAHGTVTFG